MDDLQKTGISTRPATHAVHMLSFYKEKYNLMPKDFPNAFAADQCSISLPLFHGMKQDEQDFVIEKVLEFKK
jgi:perosamine synthetase